MAKSLPLSEVNENIPRTNILYNEKLATQFRNLDKEKRNIEATRAHADTENPLCILENVDVNMNHPIVRFKYDLKSVLTYSNHDIKKWFNLNYIPYCLLNPEKCMKLHGRHIHGSMYEDVDMNSGLMGLLRDNDFFGACRYLQFCIVNKNKIPHEKVMNEMLQVVLNFKIPEDDPKFMPHVEHGILELIEECFSNLILFHPPHARYMKQYYKKLLFMPISNCKHIDHTHFDSFSGIFLYCVNRLESELLGSYKTNITQTKKQRHQNRFEIVEDFFDCSYDSLEKEERISRLFMLLRMFVDVFEQDMVFRTITYNKYEHFARKFIISFIIWGETPPRDFGCMKPCIRKIINIFVMTLRSKCSRLHCDISARLLAVIVHAVHLSTENVKRIFFNLTPRIKILAMEISIAIQTETAETVVKALQVLRPCFIKYLVSNNILNIVIRTSNNAFIGSRVINYNDILVNRLWRILPCKPPISENYDGHTSSCSETKTILNSFISVDDFIILFQGALLAFVDTFDLKAINSNNVLEIMSFFEKSRLGNNYKQIPSNENIEQRAKHIKEELVQFRQIFERHFDFNVQTNYNDNVNTDELDYCDLFEKIMKAKQKSHKIDFLQRYLYLPAITWVTGRTYYKKCALYLNVMKLIEKAKVEEKQIFQKFSI